ncbi:HBL/NHE enterotoxin family protein [Aquimarina sp. RZ0]|uniref:HBL/NHE enterotoxin family protein n=1 Tax=Aquimarina sp. RZ0 TaxID=2607730 RepID=UPI0011F2C8A6|nr:HBL/NHE enterotoxin family protein [Aquimarina sp. RZ0]KAA1244901.1 HBL/NHE enterotoxin family protein [Aquimarina sp. RZ0]
MNIEFSDPTITAAKAQVSQGLVLQGYCNSVLQQPSVDFSGFTNLAQNQIDINQGLQTAKDHANTYLNGIQTNIISNISNISNYYNLYSAVPIVLPPNATTEQWISILQAMKAQTDTYINASNLIVIDLGNLNTNIGTDVGFFTKTVSDLNAVVDGNEGVLASLSNDLSSIDTQIAGVIAGTVISGLAIVGGVFLIAVGSVASFVTAGTSLKLVAGGVAITSAGIAGSVAGTITLKNLYQQKADLLQQQSTLTSEVNLVSGINSAYSLLGSQAAEAMSATTQMKNAWTSLSSDLGVLSNNLQSGIMSTDVIRELFLTAANETVPTILQDVNIIKQQMAGVELSSTGDKGIVDYIEELTQAA